MPSKPTKSAMDCALGYLTARMRSDSEMRSYLFRKGYPEQEIGQTMGRLTELGLIDDIRFAERFVQGKTSARPIGRRSLSSLLVQKGVPREKIDQALSEFSPEEEENACLDLFGKLAGKHGTDRQGLLKIQRALVSRGFGYDTIRRAAMRFGKGDEWE